MQHQPGVLTRMWVQPGVHACMHPSVHACMHVYPLICCNSVSTSCSHKQALCSPSRKAAPQDRLTISSFATTCWAQAGGGHGPEDICLCVCRFDQKWRCRNIPGSLAVCVRGPRTRLQIFSQFEDYIVISQLTVRGSRGSSAPACSSYRPGMF